MRLCAAKRQIIKIRVQAFSKLGVVVPVKSVDINEVGSSYAVTIVNEVILRLSNTLTYIGHGKSVVTINLQNVRMDSKLCDPT